MPGGELYFKQIWSWEYLYVSKWGEGDEEQSWRPNELPGHYCHLKFNNQHNSDFCMPHLLRPFPGEPSHLHIRGCKALIWRSNPVYCPIQFACVVYKLGNFTSKWISDFSWGIGKSGHTAHIPTEQQWLATHSRHFREPVPRLAGLTCPAPLLMAGPCRPYIPDYS